MPDTEKKCVLALGFFDGVHRGHGALLQRTAERARELSAEPAVITFDTHPDALVFGRPVPLINSAPDRAYLIRRLYGIERVEFIRFSQETMRMPWQDFIESLRQEMRAVHFVVGYDFTCGYRGEGKAGLIAAYCAQNGLGCDVVGEVRLDGQTISSTYVRELIANGDMVQAQRFLGHPHILGDVVRQGHRLGRHLGAPTVNMQFSPGVLIPRHGVYAARIRLAEGAFAAVTNVGVRPTVSDENAVTVESHLLDYAGNLYGRLLCLEFFDFLRPERRFDSLTALGEQIRADGDAARRLLEEQP